MRFASSPLGKIAGYRPGLSNFVGMSSSQAALWGETYVLTGRGLGAINGQPLTSQALWSDWSTSALSGGMFGGFVGGLSAAVSGSGSAAFQKIGRFVTTRRLSQKLFGKNVTAATQARVGKTIALVGFNEAMIHSSNLLAGRGFQGDLRVHGLALAGGLLGGGIKANPLLTSAGVGMSVFPFAKTILTLGAQHDPTGDVPGAGGGFFDSLADNYSDPWNYVRGGILGLAAGHGFTSGKGPLRGILHESKNINKTGELKAKEAELVKKGFKKESDSLKLKLDEEGRALDKKIWRVGFFFESFFN